MPFDHHLGDAISNRRDPQRAHPAIALRYVDPPHRWRKVAARRQTIPKFIEVVFKISLKIRNHLAVYASRPLVGSDPLIGFPHLPFRNVIRLGSIHEGPPRCQLPSGQSRTTQPLRSSPITGPSALSGRRRRARLLSRWPPSAAQTGRAVFPHPAFTKTQLAEWRWKGSSQPSSQARTRRRADGVATFANRSSATCGAGATRSAAPAIRRAGGRAFGPGPACSGGPNHARRD